MKKRIMGVSSNHSILKLCFNQSGALFLLINLILFISGCTKSPDPTVTDLVKVRQPTFSGLTSQNFTTPSLSFLLTGECDVLSKRLEYSFNGTTWTQFATACPSGTFSTTITLTSGLSHIRVRAKGKLNYSDASTAHVRFLVPPTAPTMEMVQSSSSPEDNNGTSTQSAMSLNTDGVSVNSGANTITTTQPGIVYGP